MVTKKLYALVFFQNIVCFYNLYNLLLSFYKHKKCLWHFKFSAIIIIIFINFIVIDFIIIIIYLPLIKIISHGFRQKKLIKVNQLTTAVILVCFISF